MTPTDKTTPTVERIVEAVMKATRDNISEDGFIIPTPEAFEKYITKTIQSVLDEKVTDEQLVEILAEQTGEEDIKNKSFLHNNWATEINAIDALKALHAVRDRCARPEWVKVEKQTELTARDLIGLSILSKKYIREDFRGENVLDVNGVQAIIDAYNNLPAPPVK